MTFMQSLSSNPGGSGIAGQPGIAQNGDVLDIVNKMKDREFQDFKNKAEFMSNLSIKQRRLENMYDPSNMQPATQNPQGMNTVEKQDPNQITAPMQAELGIKQQGLNLDSQKLAQSGKLGQEAVDIKGQQEKLNQQKSDQIHQHEVDELTTKQNEYKQKMDFDNQQLQNRALNAEQQLALHKSIADNTKSYHDLEMQRKQLEFDKTHAQMQQKIDLQDKQLKQRNQPTTKTETDSTGASRITTTSKGGNAPVKNADGTYTVTAPYDDPSNGIHKGDTGTIPADKLDHWMQNFNSSNSSENEDQGQ